MKGSLKFYEEIFRFLLFYCKKTGYIKKLVEEIPVLASCRNGMNFYKTGSMFIEAS